MPGSSLEDLLALAPAEFEKLVAHLFESMGYEVDRVGKPGDEGVDLRLRQGEGVSIVQCKRYRGTVGQPAVRDFYGAIQHEGAVRGYFVTTGTFSLAASTWAQGKPIALVDGPDLAAAIENASIPVQGDGLPDAEAESSTIASAIQVALERPLRHGRILLDGAPPTGRNYAEVAEYIRRSFADADNGFLTLDGKSLRPKPSEQAVPENVLEWYGKQARGVLFVNEFDYASRRAMEELLKYQQTPRGKVYDGRRRRFRIKPVKAHVLVASRWEKQLPKIVHAKFPVIIHVNDIEWDRIPNQQFWAKLRRQEAQRERENAHKREARRKQAEARREAEAVEARQEAERIRREIAQKVEREKAELEAFPGVFCDRCKLWEPRPESQADCGRCGRRLVYDRETGAYRTEHSGIFGTSWSSRTWDELQKVPKAKEARRKWIAEALDRYRRALEEGTAEA